jgi:UDP-glucose 4-epimerase
VSVAGNTYLVTGGAGFIGGHLCAELLGAGAHVRVLDDFRTGRRENLQEADPEGRIDLHEGSVTDPDAVARAVAGCAGVIHLAALPSVSRSIEAPVESNEINVTGTLRVLEAVQREGAKLVYAGSSSAYGDQDVPLKHEELRENTLSPYAASKLAGELYCRAFARVHGLSIVVTRFFNVFGPRQVPDSPYSGVIAAFCYRLLRGESPRIDGDGSQSRDFTFVGDVVRGLRLAMATDTGPGCRTINLATGGNHTVLSLFETLRDLAGASVEPTFASPRKGDVQHSQADISFARELIGFEPRVSFTDGLRQTLDWYRESARPQSERSS